MMAYGNDVVCISDLDALIKSIATINQKDTGITLFASKPNSSLVIDFGASHHMTSNPKLINNVKQANG